MTVSLTPELDDFISSRLDAGRYVSASEVVREGLRLLEEKERLREARLIKLHQEIQVGLDQIEAGEVVDAEETFDEIESWLEGWAEPAA